MIDCLKDIEKSLIVEVKAQLVDLNKVNTEEMGEVIDMIKDLSKAIYNHTIVKSMEEKNEEVENTK